MSMHSNLLPARLGGRAASPLAMHLAFYLGVPTALALLYTLLRAGPAAVLPMPLAFGLLSLIVFPGWWAAQLVARLSWFALRPWTPPLWFLCLIGSFGQALLLSPIYRFAFGSVDRIVGTGRMHGNPPLPEFSLAYAGELVLAVAPGALLMIGINYAFDRLLGYPRLRYPAPAEASSRVQTRIADPASAPADPPTPCALLARSRLPADSEIWALTAEEHYVCIYSDRGSDLVRYRFNDALRDMAGSSAGLQVHRSWWVRPDRVASWTDRGRSLELVLRDGTRVPVSLAFRAAALMALGAPSVQQTQVSSKETPSLARAGPRD